MSSFIDRDFLLDTDTARRLFHGEVDGLPIFDYHCHLQPREIAEDRPFEDIAEIWLKGDHYKWRIMRTNGAPESLCSGKGAWADKFRAYAAALENSPGNPLLHWSHLELQRTYGIRDVLTSENALEIRERANAIIKERGDSPRSMLRHYKVAVVCTTDDPADDLGWHRAIAQDPDMDMTRVLPTFRPDKAMNSQDATAWKAYVAQLGEAAGMDIRTYADLADALETRHTFFHGAGCRLSDHALLVPPFAPATEAELDAIVCNLLAGRQPSALDSEKLATAVLLHIARLNAKAGWTMQLHIGATRNANRRLFASYGPDGGADSISDQVVVAPLARFLDILDAENALPKTILYTMDDTKNASLAALAQCFAMGPNSIEGSISGKMQFGSAWWMNDHLDGMERHLLQTASLGSVGAWVGMLTDSRSFLSYPRHEYFRRILCRVTGRWVESGELPDDDRYAGAFVRNVSWFNAARYFGIELPEWAAKVRS